MVWTFFESLLGMSVAVQGAAPASGRQLAARQHIVIANSSELRSIDPHKMPAAVPEDHVIVNLLEGLCILDPEGEIVPGVATHWEQSNGGKTWTFHLRPEARWSNGDAVTAADFVFGWQRLANPDTASPQSSILVELQLLNAFAVIHGREPATALGIQAIDEHTLQLQLTKAHPFLIKMLAAPALFPVHRATVEQYPAAWTSPARYVGNGAYRLQEWRVNEKLVLTRNSLYWGDGRTSIEQVTFLPLAAEAERLRYRRGEIDMTYSRLPDDDFSQLQREFPRDLRFFPSMDVYGLTINNRVPPFQDVRVRRALALGIDRSLLVKQAFMRGQTVGYAMVPDGVQEIKVPTPKWVTWTQERRNREAQKLLQAAGYTAQRPLQFTLLYNSSEVNRQMMLFLSSSWQQNLPVRATLEAQEWKSYTEAKQFGRYQVSRFAWVASYNEPYDLLCNLRSWSERNSANYRSQQFDNYLDGILLAQDERSRRYAYQRALEQLAEDLPMIPLFHSLEFRLVKPRVGGLSERNRMPVFYVKDLFISADPA